MLRPQILNRLGRRPLQARRSYQELILGRDENVERFGVALHVKNVFADNGHLTDNANFGGLFGQDEAVNFVVLLDGAGIGGTSGQADGDSHVQRMDGAGQRIESSDELGFIGGFLRQGGGGRSHSSFRASGTAAEPESDQSQPENVAAASQ